MKITVLTENTASSKFKAEHGLSYLIEHDVPLLFDTGHSDIYMQNAQTLGVDLNDVKTVILSHGHWDHGNGLKFILDKELICHPAVFRKRYRKGGDENIGLDLSFEELSKQFKIKTSAKPYYVSEDIIFLGEIPRLISFESQTTSFVLEDKSNDFVTDDSGLVVKLNDEILIISGCAHSGICNMIEYAKQITGIQKIRAVIGGFHLKHNNKQTQETIKYLKSQDIQELYPSHCTDLPALSAFYNEFDIKQLKSGMILNFD